LAAPWTASDKASAETGGGLAGSELIEWSRNYKVVYSVVSTSLVSQLQEDYWSVAILMIGARQGQGCWSH
jgi:hypothetical protein